MKLVTTIQVRLTCITLSCYIEIMGLILRKSFEPIDQEIVCIISYKCYLKKKKKPLKISNTEKLEIMR